MRDFFFLFFLIVTQLSFAKEQECKLPFNWEIKAVGKLSDDKVGLNTEFHFLSPEQVIMLNFPKGNEENARVSIYKKVKNIWTFDPDAALKLPKTFHPRHILKADIDNDKFDELIISDHGTDRPPFNGARTIVIKKEKNKWIIHPLTHLMPISAIFNTAFIKWGKDRAGVFRASMMNGKASFFELQDHWVDASHSLPGELTKTDLCMMTALSEDFDGDGSGDLFLGGCDKEKEQEFQKHDRILTNKLGKWVLLPSSVIPPRDLNTTWGTVYVKKLYFNHDQKPDLIVSTHDHGFHKWMLNIYVNQSRPGLFSFRKMSVPLLQEANTEGFVNSYEITSLPGYKNIIFVEVRSFVRDKTKVDPKKYNRLLVQVKDQLMDATECLPARVSDTPYKMRKIPSTANEFLLVPYSGEILQLKLSLK